MKILNFFKKKKQNDRGFTLIEIIVAVFMLTIALLSLVSVTVIVIKGNAFSKTMTAATTLARDKMEELKNTDYSSVTSSASTETVQNMYQRSWTVTTDSPAANMKTVVVTVNWSWNGQTRNVTLQSIISN